MFIYVICVCLRIVVSHIVLCFCFVFLRLHVVSFSGLSFFDCPSVFSNVYLVATYFLIYPRVMFIGIYRHFQQFQIYRDYQTY